MDIHPHLVTVRELPSWAGQLNSTGTPSPVVFPLVPRDYKRQELRGESTVAKISKAAVKGKKAITRTVLVPADEADVKRLEDAKSAATRARLLGRADDQAAADAKLAEVTEEVREAGLEFVFRGIGRKRYEALLREHQPTDEQKADAEARKVSAPQWNVDTFPAALCHASCVDSELSAEEWASDIFESEDWGPGELGSLFNAAIDANSDRRVVELGN